MPRAALVVSIALLALLSLVSGGPAAARPSGAGAVAPLPEGTESLPPGVTVQTVLDNVDRPVALAFDPQGRLFFTEKDSGNVRLYANGVLQPDPVITFGVNSFNERGLLGIAVDPNFSQNHYLYVYYTCAPGPACPTLENRVARFVESEGLGTNPTTLFASPVTASAGQHNGGNLHFGPDGKLYFTIGDDAQAANAQNVADPHGKMHRLNPDGSPPADNPHFAAGALPSLYALGLRNSFDFTFDPLTPGRIFASENGPACDDELNRVEAGGNYGWRADYPCDDTAAGGPDAAYNTIPPLWTNGTECCVAPTGITVYTGEAIPGWRGDLFMATFLGRGLYHFHLNADRTIPTSVNIIPAVRANLALVNAPDGALWYIEGGGSGDGAIKRVVGPGAAPLPTAPPTPPAGPPATPTAGPNPPTIPGSGSMVFPQTGQTLRGLFLEYWTIHGGLAQQGFPISGLLTEVSDLDGRPYTVQYFERAVFEYHPENQPPFDVLLSQLGTFQYRKKYPGGAPNQQANTSGAYQSFPQTGHTVGGRFWAYWQGHGGLAQQGYPISDEFTEISDLNGQPYTVQYFERAVFEWHPENQPPFDVLLSQLGTFRYHAKYP